MLLRPKPEVLATLFVSGGGVGAAGGIGEKYFFKGKAGIKKERNNAIYSNMD